MRPLILSALLLAAAVTSLPSAHAAAPKTAAVSAKTEHGETAALRRTLASALVVKAINPTVEQKRALQAAISDLRAVRDAAKADKDIAALQDRRQAVLTKAIGEARATGSVSAATKAEMKDLREDGKDERGDVRGKAKDAMTRIRGVLTPAQLEAVRGLAAGMPEGKRHGAKAKGTGAGEGKAGQRGKGRLLRLMMSDEFSAELAR